MSEEQFIWLDPEQCVPFLNLRLSIDPAKYADTKESIKTWGIRQNVNARPHPDGSGRYEVYAGRLRLKIAQELKEDGHPFAIYRLPSLVKEADEMEVYAVTLSENIDRADVSPYAVGNWLQMMQMKFGMTQRDLATKVGKSQSWVNRHIRIVQELQKESVGSGLDIGKLDALPQTERQARALRSVDPELRQRVFEEAAETGEMPSARDIERRASATATPEEILKRYKPATVDDDFVEYLLQEEAGLTGAEAREKVRNWRWGQRRRPSGDVKVSATDPTVQLYNRLGQYYPLEVIDEIEKLTPSKNFETMTRYLNRYVARLFAKSTLEVRQAVLEEWML